jgi:hypothetical protein
MRLQLAAATATGVCARCWSAAGAQPARNGCTFAAAIAGRFPEIASRLPKARTLTMSEQYEMPVFDDMAFAQAFFYFRNRKRLLEQRKLLKSAFQRAE